MARVGIGLREHRVERRDAGIRDEALRPVEDVLVAVAPRRRAHRGRVGARAGLGERVGAEPFAAREPRQVARLLLVGAGELQAERAELLHREDEPARRADLRHLFDRDEREQRARAEAAVLLVEEEAEDVVLAEELDDVPRKLVRLVDLRRARRDPLARERPDEVADLALLVGQLIPGHRADCRATRACGRRPRGCCRRGRARRRRSRSGGMPAGPGAPLSSPPAASAASWKASTVARSSHVNATCVPVPTGSRSESHRGRRLVFAEADGLPLVERHHDPVAERRERLLVEGTARRVVPHVQADMVEHRSSLTSPDGEIPVAGGRRREKSMRRNSHDKAQACAVAGRARTRGYRSAGRLLVVATGGVPLPHRR